MAAQAQNFDAAGIASQDDAPWAQQRSRMLLTRPVNSIIAPRVGDIAETGQRTSESTWHAVWTRSRHEPLVCTELGARGVDMFLPTVTRVSTWSDRKKRIASPLFPGYCFARVEPDVLSKIVRCTGVVTVLSNGGVPVPIPGFEIEALQRVVASGLAYDPCVDLVEGSRVRVINGPLTGVVGRLVRKGAQDLLILAVELLNGGARVQVSTRDIEAL
jgi:transcription antitermination factor NusG